MLSRTGDAVLNGLLLAATALLIGALVLALHHLQHVPAVKVLQPKLHSLLVLLNLLLMLVFLLADTFRVFSWGTTGILIYSIVSWIHVVVFFIVVNYYLAFCASEDKLKLAVRVVCRLQSFKGLTDEYSSKHVRILKLLVKELRFKVALFLGVWFISVIPVLVAFAFDGSFSNAFYADWEREGQVSHTVGVVALTLISSVFIYSNVYIDWEMKKRSKDLGVRSLMQKNYTYASSLVLSTIILFVSLPRTSAVAGFHFRTLLIFEINMWFYSISFLRTLNEHRRSLRADEVDATKIKRVQSEDIVTAELCVDQSKEILMFKELKSVLCDEEGWKLMLEEARKQFCVENILFHGAVEEWKLNFKNSSASRRREDAFLIIDLFCSTKSTAEVNLSCGVKEELSQKIADQTTELTVELFDDALSEILGFIVQQTFSRLRSSSRYRDYCSKSKQGLQSVKLT